MLCGPESIRFGIICCGPCHRPAMSCGFLCGFLLLHWQLLPWLLLWSPRPPHLLPGVDPVLSHPPTSHLHPYTQLPYPTCLPTHFPSFLVTTRGGHQITEPLTRSLRLGASQVCSTGRAGPGRQCRPPRGAWRCGTPTGGRTQCLGSPSIARARSRRSVSAAVCARRASQI